MPTSFHRPLTALFDGDPRIDLARSWLHANATGLLNACLLLGGPAAHRRGLRLIDEIREAERLTRRHARELVETHRLPTLQNVGDPDREETSRFAEINPASREVLEICLLADSLHSLLRSIAQTSHREQSNGEAREAPRAAA